MNKIKEIDLCIIGGGPAGMSAALCAYENGIKNIMIFEREKSLGGILNQCIHNGFGLHKLKEELTGPEYAWHYQKQIEEHSIPYMLETTVIDISKDKVITATNSTEMLFKVKAKAIILAMGCRERSRGPLTIAGSRPAGVFTAGTAQKFVNQYGYLPGSKAVILGSGDIGLIMARRLTLEGAEVLAVCEIMPVAGGLPRNIVQCLEDFNIPLLLSHTVIEIHGKDRLIGVTIAKVDENKNILKNTSKYIECDILLLSVGLIPENELAEGAGVELSPITGGAVVDENRATSVEGIFSCGNVLHVHDLVDYVSDEAEIAGRSAASFLKNISNNGKDIKTCFNKNQTYVTINAGEGIGYTVPQKCTAKEKFTLFFRTNKSFKNAVVKLIDNNGNIIYKRKRPYLIPAEMQRITLNLDMLSEISSQDITLSVEGEE